MPHPHSDPLSEVTKDSVRLTLDLEGAVLDFPGPDCTLPTKAWLTVEERTKEGITGKVYPVMVTEGPGNSFFVTRIIE